MLLLKTRDIPLCKEKKSRNPDKPYFTPTCYSSIKKSGNKMSRFYKKEYSV